LHFLTLPWRSLNLVVYKLLILFSPLWGFISISDTPPGSVCHTVYHVVSQRGAVLLSAAEQQFSLHHWLHHNMQPQRDARKRNIGHSARQGIHVRTCLLIRIVRRVRQDLRGIFSCFMASSKSLKHARVREMYYLPSFRPVFQWPDLSDKQKPRKSAVWEYWEYWESMVLWFGTTHDIVALLQCPTTVERGGLCCSFPVLRTLQLPSWLFSPWSPSIVITQVIGGS